MKAIVAWDNLARRPGTGAGVQPARRGCPSKRARRRAVTKPALGMSADYGLTPTPYTSDPDRSAKCDAVARSYAAAGRRHRRARHPRRHALRLLVHPEPRRSAATLRGADDSPGTRPRGSTRYVKGDRRPTARLLTDRWRNDAAEAAVDPDHDGNLFSFYYDSPLSVDGRTCADLRTAQACPLAPDGLGPFSALGAAGLG